MTVGPPSQPHRAQNDADGGPGRRRGAGDAVGGDFRWRRCSAVICWPGWSRWIPPTSRTAAGGGLRLICCTLIPVSGAALARHGDRQPGWAGADEPVERAAHLDLPDQQTAGRDEERVSPASLSRGAAGGGAFPRPGGDPGGVAGWAGRPRFGAALVHAEGGQGKTRLAYQLAAELSGAADTATDMAADTAASGPAGLSQEARRRRRRWTVVRLIRPLIHRAGGGQGCGPPVAARRHRLRRTRPSSLWSR